MKEIQRFHEGGYGTSEMKLSDYGDWVLYGDHAEMVTALQKQVLALAAENVLVREQSEEVYAVGYNHGHLNTADGIAYAPGTKDDFYPNALQVMAEVETPSTDTVLREIRAQAVDDFGIYHNFSDKQLIQAEAKKYAARMRSGEQP